MFRLVVTTGRMHYPPKLEVWGERPEAASRPGLRGVAGGPEAGGRGERMTTQLVKIEDIESEFQWIDRFQEEVHKRLIPDVDYGQRQGMRTKTLLKPGAEKITKLMRLADTYEIIAQREDWPHEADTPFFRYLVRCTLKRMEDGMLITQGMGECNTMEAAYRWRWLWERELPEGFDKDGAVTRTVNNGTQYRIDNDDTASLVNTVLKMAEKRALVDATLHAGRLSNLFTQDLEDMTTVVTVEATVAPAAQGTPTPAPLAEPAKQPAISARTCPLHGEQWRTNKNGKQYHFVGTGDDKKFCNPSDGYVGILKAGMAKGELGKGEAEDLLGRRYDCRWGDLSAVQCIELAATFAEQGKPITVDEATGEVDPLPEAEGDAFIEEIAASFVDQSAERKDLVAELVRLSKGLNLPMESVEGRIAQMTIEGLRKAVARLSGKPRPPVSEQQAYEQGEAAASAVEAEALPFTPEEGDE